jgi:Flp pilus assembly pilin Flp
MGDLLKGIEYLGIPGTIAVALVGLFVVCQVIGEIAEAFGKIVPECLKVRKYFSRKKKENEESKQALIEVKQLLSEVNAHYNKDNITKRNDWMHEVDDSVKNNDKLVHTLVDKIDKLLDANENLKNQLHQVESKVLENEADRLRSELFDCGNRCRRNIRLHPEEMAHMHDVYHKYANVLGQNGSGEAEFKFITDYYNHQTFPTYHQPNTKE